MHKNITPCYVLIKQSDSPGPCQFLGDHSSCEGRGPGGPNTACRSRDLHAPPVRVPPPPLPEMTEPRADRERFRHGPPHMAPRANPCTKGTGPICRLPLPALTYSTRGYKPWRPDAVSGTARHYTEPGPDRGLPCQGDFV